MKSDALIANELLEVIEQRRQLDRREEELKSYFRTRLKGLNVDTVTIGGILISLVEKSRSSLDRKALEVAFTYEVISRYEKITTYTQVDIKQANVGTQRKAA